MDRNKTARPFRSVCPEPVLASDCTCRIRKEGSRENGAVFLNVMLGAEPPHQGGGRHGQDLRCAFDCDAEFPSVFRRNERSFAKTGSGQARKRGNVPLKEERFFWFFSLSVRLPRTRHSGDDLSAREGKNEKTHDVFRDPFYTKNDASFCQDRLGTNI